MNANIKHGDWLAQRPPTKTGVGGWKAWKIDATPQMPDQEATIAAWLLYCPGAHAFWSYWMLGVVHLRPMAGVRPAFKKFESASHELTIFSLNPEHAPPDPIGWGAMRYLEPVDVVEQFQVPDDAKAARVAELAVERVMTGEISPDQDYRTVWHAMIAATADHFSTGHQHGADRN